MADPVRIPKRRKPGPRAAAKHRCFTMARELREVSGGTVAAVLVGGVEGEPDAFAIAAGIEKEPHVLLERLKRIEDILRQGIAQTQAHIEAIKQGKTDKILEDVTGGRIIH